MIKKDFTLIEKSLLCGYMGQQIRANVNNKPFDVNATKQFNRILISKDLNRNLKFSIADRELPIYGITFESESGIIVDNFSFRGITGIEYSKIDVEFLQKISEFNPYDLIVFQYGVNLMFRPDDKNFNYYAHLIKPVITKIKSGFKGADFLIVSTADRAFRYGGTFKSAIGIDSLIKVQATLAYETESNFYNLYESMGGKNSIIDWATRKPSLANKDYVHPNNRGAEILGNYFFEALMSNYKKYLNSVQQ